MKIFYLLFVVLMCSVAMSAQDFVLRSPNGKAEVHIRVADKVSYSISFDRRPVVNESPISLSIKEHTAMGTNPKVIEKKQRKVNEIVTNPVPDKRRKIKDSFNELQLTFHGSYGLVWRAYDNGIAYRWVTDLPGRVTVSGEQAEINLNAQDTIYYPQEDSFYSHNERTYKKFKSAEL
ncbi:MAG TPA: glycoside hydrolase family 97 N-terminal domain-containing protein, partial [Pyrinomonadaceae bacterium]|nr:glycoside hydrolase family 97 N-terminal domain-containing protein [Pyrinomonadaceae bacterium]